MTRNAKALQSRARAHQVTLRGDAFEVLSASGSTYTVTPLAHGGASCSCEWGRLRLTPCSHQVAVYAFAARLSGKRVSVWSSPDAAARQHRPVQVLGDGLLLTVRS